MNKRVRTGLITLVIAALAGYGIHTFYPLGQKADKDDVPVATNVRKSLQVTAYVVKPETLTNEIIITGDLLPDEEVNLSFETSGKITAINFTEGTHVNKRRYSGQSQ